MRTYFAFVLHILILHRTSNSISVFCLNQVTLSVTFSPSSLELNHKMAILTMYIYIQGLAEFNLKGHSDFETSRWARKWWLKFLQNIDSNDGVLNKADRLIITWYNKWIAQPKIVFAYSNHREQWMHSGIFKSNSIFFFIMPTPLISQTHSHCTKWFIANITMALDFRTQALEMRTLYKISAEDSRASIP